MLRSGQYFIRKYIGSDLNNIQAYSIINIYESSGQALYMKKYKLIRFIIIAVGVLTSAAFYIHNTISPDTGNLVYFEGSGDGDMTVAGTDGEISGDKASSDISKTLPQGYQDSAHYEHTDDLGTASASFSDLQRDEIDSIVRNAVREELLAICSDGYMEKALSEAARLSEAEAKKHEGMININTAGVSELMSLDGIGEKRAGDIISYRESCGGFRSTEELMNVSGIKQASFDKIKDKIYV